MVCDGGAALQGGPLRVSQPLMVITDPVVSIALAAAAAGFCVMCVGVVVSLTAPPTLQADVEPAGAPRIRST